MEHDRPLLYGEAGPQLKSARAQEKVKVLLLKLVHTLFSSRSLDWQERFPADMLHLILGQVRGLGNVLVSPELTRLARWLCGSKPNKQCCAVQLILALQTQTLELHFIFNNKTRA